LPLSEKQGVGSSILPLATNGKEIKIYNLIDIGASVGEFSEFLYKNSEKKCNIFAIEPLLESFNKIKIGSNKKFNIAIGTESKIKEMNIYSNSELSSFEKINESINKDIWKHHLPGTKIIETREVQTITLETFLINNNLTKVDFVKVDTQGNDLSIILSANKRLNSINSFVIECAYSVDSMLYETGSLLKDVFSFVEDSDFFIYRIVPNGAGECNVFCINKNYGIENYEDLEKNLKFYKAPCLKLENNFYKFLKQNYDRTYFRYLSKLKVIPDI